jgi:hypothetical protein
MFDGCCAPAPVKIEINEGLCAAFGNSVGWIAIVAESFFWFSELPGLSRSARLSSSSSRRSFNSRASSSKRQPRDLIPPGGASPRKSFANQVLHVAFVIADRWLRYFVKNEWHQDDVQWRSMRDCKLQKTP